MRQRHLAVGPSLDGVVPAMRDLLPSNAFGSTGTRRGGRDWSRRVMRVGNVSYAIEVERGGSLWRGDGSERRIDRDIGRGLLEGRGVLIAGHLLVNDDVLPFLVVDDWG